MVKLPRVSVCVPNLNTRAFLPERFSTIFEQSFQDWELLVYDSYSDDGAWEYIKAVAEAEPRMRIWQGPREGTPGSWNPCLREARGEYVYIATSDDTMAPDLLEKLVGALDAHPECDLAHCRLREIDERGRETSNWWTQESLFALSSGPLIHSPHVRRAPFDGLLHLAGDTVYVSITQLLVRRSLFSRIGLFESTWGSVGDFHWGMRAGLVANTVHVPDTWGGWRVHRQQATAHAAMGSPSHQQRITEMIEHAIGTCRSLLPPGVADELHGEWRSETARRRAFHQGVAARRQSPLSRRMFVAQELFRGSAAARAHVTAKFLGHAGWPETFVQEVLQSLGRAGAGPVLIPS
jgi:hypothetical protein